MTDAEGYLLLSDGSVRYLGRARSVEFRNGTVVLCWAPVEIKGEGWTVALGVESGHYQAAVEIEQQWLYTGCTFAGTVELLIPTLAPWRDLIPASVAA
jgi:hypothetical protein